MPEPDPQPSLDPRDPHELAPLADGSLPPEREQRLRARVADSPELAVLLREQQAALEAVRELAMVGAPERLRAAVGELAGTSVRPGAHRRARVPGPRRRASRPALRIALPGLVAALAATAVAVVLAVAPGGPGAPSVVQAAALALRAPTMPAPRQNALHPQQLARAVQGVAFPYWQDRFGWRTVGARVDGLGGRRVTTVYYRDRGGARLAYSIVSGASLPWPQGARLRTYGVEFRLLGGGTREILTWRRGDHTCIFSATGVPIANLVVLAAWQ